MMLRGKWVKLPHFAPEDDAGRDGTPTATTTVMSSSGTIADARTPEQETATKKAHPSIQWSGSSQGFQVWLFLLGHSLPSSGAYIDSGARARGVSGVSPIDDIINGRYRCGTAVAHWTMWSQYQR
jgi:hypothetical protein